MLAEQALDIQALKAVTAKTGNAQGEESGPQWAVVRFGLSERRVCRLLALDRNTLRYRRRGPEDTALRTRIREIAESKRRHGCPRIYVRLRREGWPVNHKKVERIYYRDEGLALRRRRRKKLAAVPRVALPRPTQPGRCYAMDFVHDRLVTGRWFKCLTMTDPCSKEVPVIEVDVTIGGAGVSDSGSAVSHAPATGNLDPG
jgi:putative transposase